MALVLAVFICFTTGYFIVALAWPKRALRAGMPLRSSLSVGFGLGLFSVTFVVARLCNSNHLMAIDLLCLAVLLSAFLICRTSPAVGLHGTLAPEDIDLPYSLRRFLLLAFAVAIAAACYSSIVRAIAHPHGEGWDAFAIWNLHARFLFRAGPNWRDAFSQLIPWSHPDYPLLIPASVAHFWTYLANDNPGVPATISVAFAAATTLLLHSSLKQLRGRNAAMLGTLSLLSTPFFIQQGTAQYADVPLSFFLLATIVLIQFSERSGYLGLLVLASIAAGFAAWTKNEGLLFLCAAVSVQVLQAVQKVSSRTTSSLPDGETWRSFAAFAVGSVPLLLLVGWFKHSAAPPGDLFSSPAAMVAKLATSARYWVILQWFIKEVLRFGEWWIVPGTVSLAIFYFLAPASFHGQSRPVIKVSAWILALTITGYFAIYLITPYDLYWHLRFSLNRLFLQLWPAVIFLFFSSVSFRYSPTVSK